MWQMCTVDELTGGEPCRRWAQFAWQPAPGEEIVYLCRVHAEPWPDALMRPLPERASG